MLAKVEDDDRSCMNAGEPSPHHNIVGKNQQISEILDALATVAESSSNVLIYGERGVGKALLAKSIHSNSQRRYQPYVRVNCSRQSQSTLQEDHFGYERSANVQRTGGLELSQGGTLFLADIENMPYEMQVKLLQALEDGEYVRDESTDSARLDVRLIAATTENLREKVSSGEFREDLFYRLNVVPLFLAPAAGTDGRYTTPHQPLLRIILTTSGYLCRFGGYRFACSVHLAGKCRRTGKSNRTACHDERRTVYFC